ncbi:transposase, partial [Lentzea aerocolonigenes]
VQLKGEALAHTSEAVPAVREWSGTGRCGRRPADTPVYPDEPVSLARHVAAAGREAALTVTWREGSKGALSSQFVFLRVRPAGHRVPRDLDDGILPERWLIAQWPDDEPEPVTYWLSSLPADTSHTDLIRYAKIRWRIEHDYRELKTGLGLDHFEGRSWQGWHRHVTLVTAAHLFLTLLRADPKAAAPA